MCIIRQLARALSNLSKHRALGKLSSPSQPWLTLSSCSPTGNVLTPSQIFCSAYEQHYYMLFYLHLAKLPDFEALEDDLFQGIS